MFGRAAGATNLTNPASKSQAQINPAHPPKTNGCLPERFWQAPYPHPQPHSQISANDYASAIPW
jgi:hypothetical protein